jgi:glycosyltransferase involved in cell wall biosynthesis
MNRPIKVLYVFANERKKMEQEWLAGKMPDTYFIGLNHLKDFGIQAEYYENRLINSARQKSFNLANILLLFKIRKYDIIFSGSSLLIVFLAKNIFRFQKPKFVWYNTFFTNLIRRNNRGLKKWFVEKTINYLDAIICPSQAQKDFLIKQGFEKNKIFYIPTGVDVDFIQKQKNNLKPAEEKYILSVGKDMGRDYKTLIEAVKGLDIKVKIVALLRNFNKKDLGNLPPNVEFLGFMPFNKLVKLYLNAEFIVVSTKKENDLGASDCSGHYVLLDAMASGKAIIASNRSTISDYVTDGQEGILVKPENSEELRNVIEKLLNNPQLAEEMGKRALEKIKAGMTTKMFAEKLARVFKEMEA